MQILQQIYLIKPVYLEQDYFSDENRIYFDDEIYHEKIRVPLMKYFGNRIKKRYNSGESEEELI